jgi:Icc-related predicted phosphoesterase
MSLFGRGKRSGTRTRVFFATDVHGSERCFRKWLNAAAAYEADVLILGGDVTGKLLVPVVENGDGTWHADIFDERIAADTPEALEELRKRIRMMGRYDVVVSSAGEQALADDPAVVADTFERVTTESLQRWTALAEERLGERGTPVYMMLGNDDEQSLADVLRASDFVHYAEDGVLPLPGGWELLSYGPSTPTPWDTPRERSEDEIAAALAELAGAVTNPGKTVYNVHCPPYDTHLDQAPALDDDLRPVVDASGVKMISVGSTAVREAIERHQPVVGLHGHVHESPGASKLRESLCINPGSEYADGVLKGAIVDLDSERGLRSWQMVQG